MAEQSLRRTTRVLLKIPINVSGTGQGDCPFDEKTFTVEINGYGAQIALRASPRPGDRLTITNLQNRKTCPFRVVGIVKKPSGGEREYGVECLQPEEDFWGIYFPERTTISPPTKKEIIDALLECQKCGFREMAQLTVDQFKILGEQPYPERGCPRCGEPTEWTYAYLEEEEMPHAEPQPSSILPPSVGDIEKRICKRVTVQLPVRIRFEDGREEVAQTVNISKTGVCFVSRTEMKAGDSIRLTVGYAGPGSGTEVVAKVAWRKELAGANRIVYGVHVVEPS